MSDTTTPDFSHADGLPSAPAEKTSGLEVQAQIMRHKVLCDLDALKRAQAEVRRLELLVNPRLAAYQAFLKCWRDLHNLTLAPPCPARLELHKTGDEIPF